MEDIKVLIMEDLILKKKQLQDYIRYTFNYIYYLQQAKKQAEEICSKIQAYMILEKNEMLEEIQTKYSEFEEFISTGYEEEQ